MLREKKKYIFFLLKKNSSNLTQITNLIKFYLEYIKDFIIKYTKKKWFINRQSSHMRFRGPGISLRQYRENKINEENIRYLNETLFDGLPAEIPKMEWIINEYYCDNKLNLENIENIPNQELICEYEQMDEIMDFLKNIYIPEFNENNQNYNQIIENLDKLIEYIDNIYNLIKNQEKIQEKGIAPNVLHSGIRYLGGTKFVHVKGIGKRKVRYYKNGNRYIIVHGKKKKL